MKPGDKIRTPRNLCLGGCGKVLDAGTMLDTFETPGDDEEKCVSLCANCGHIAMYTAEWILRPLTDAEMLEVAGEPTIIAAQKARVRAKQEEAFFRSFKSEGSS